MPISKVDALMENVSDVVEDVAAKVPSFEKENGELKRKAKELARKYLMLLDKPEKVAPREIALGALLAAAEKLGKPMTCARLRTHAGEKSLSFAKIAADMRQKLP